MQRTLSAAVFGVALSAAVASVTTAQAADLVIWWTKGVTPEEDEALQRVVEQW